MTIRQVYIFFILISSILSEAYASSQHFILKTGDLGEVFLEMKMLKGYSIYANGEVSKFGLPIKITLNNSYNLKDYKIIWPDSQQKHVAGIGVINYFDGLVRIQIKVQAKDSTKPVNIEADLEYAICSDMCIPVKQTIITKIDAIEKGFGFEKYFVLIILSILGGFVLNFMPCVLPVLSLKMFSFLRNDSIDKKIACLLTIAGIFSSFWSLTAIVISLKHTGSQFGLGANFQEPEFIIILSIIITIFISGASERIDLSLPDNLMNKLNISKLSNQYLEHYFSGVLAAILSTPCNAPFLGTAVSLALAANNFQIFLNFSFVALGFSSPYIIMIFYPSVLKIIPKPGAWILVLKKILVLFMAGTVFWLLFVLYGQIGERATIGVFLLLLLLKFSLESVTGIMKNRGLKWSIVLGIILASLILPIGASNEDLTTQMQIDNTWHKFERDKIKTYVDQGKIIFVNITADWCVSCKYNNLMVLNRDKTMKLFQEYEVYAMKGDFSSHNQEIYDYIVANGSYGIPFYKIYGPKKPQGLVLPIIISYSDIKLAIREVW
jgi:suppressor for copper-sensitivity B